MITGNLFGDPIELAPKPAPVDLRPRVPILMPVPSTGPTTICCPPRRRSATLSIRHGPLRRAKPDRHRLTQNLGRGESRRSQGNETIDSILNVPALPQLSLEFAKWIAKYALAPLGMVATRCGQIVRFDQLRKVREQTWIGHSGSCVDDACIASGF
jgi:hypothetical protein